MKKIIDKRPWGKEDIFIINKKSTVKILYVKPGGTLSLQYHNHRKECWHIISGKGLIILGKKKKKFKMGDEFVIPVKTNHRIKATTEVRILEIGLGKFDEKDIVRLEDKYGRKKIYSLPLIFPR